jgi:bifunctional non-homologous end joining protein LigD
VRSLAGMPPADVRPAFVVPMKAMLTAERPAGPEWVFERKLDGIRCLAVKAGGRTRLYSRNELSLNDRYSPLATALDADPADGFVADGEAVAFVGGRDRFGGGEGGELFYYVFDVLYANGRDVRSLPLEERRSKLEGLLRWQSPLRMTEQMTGDGAALLADACRDGWEGLIAKRLGTPYASTRSRDWLKLKCTRSQELVIGGFTAPRGSRTDLGALLVGHFEGSRFPLCRQSGNGLHPPDAAGVVRAARPARARILPVRAREGHSTHRDLDRTRARGTDRLHGMDVRRSAASSLLPWLALRQGRARRRARSAVAGAAAARTWHPHGGQCNDATAHREMKSHA